MSGCGQLKWPASKIDGPYQAQTTPYQIPHIYRAVRVWSTHPFSLTSLSHPGAVTPSLPPTTPSSLPLACSARPPPSPTSSRRHALLPQACGPSGYLRRETRVAVPVACGCRSACGDDKGCELRWLLPALAAALSRVRWRCWRTGSDLARSRRRQRGAGSGDKPLNPAVQP